LSSGIFGEDSELIIGRRLTRMNADNGLGGFRAELYVDYARGDYGAGIVGVAEFHVHAAAQVMRHQH